jgi:hypothetical protein
VSVNVHGAPTPRVLRRIGLWGPPRSGKTTYLAALNVAVARARQDLLIFGVDDEAIEFLADNTRVLTQQRRFPTATEDLRRLSWIMQMPIQRGTRKKFRRQQAETVQRQFNLNLLDLPESFFVSKQGLEETTRNRKLGSGDDKLISSRQASDDELIDDLVGCDGLVYLFDPIREREVGDAYQDFLSTLLRIAQRQLKDDPAINAKLPHYLAVCISKFDHPQVYQQARLGGFCTFSDEDPFLFPRVHDDSAAPFFDDLCHASNGGNADLIPGAIRKFFMAERVRYFAISAIGFHTGRGSRFWEHDYQNVVRDENGEFRIRGAIHPINVVEPLLWLGQRLTAPGRNMA